MQNLRRRGLHILSPSVKTNFSLGRGLESNRAIRKCKALGGENVSSSLLAALFAALCACCALLGSLGLVALGGRPNGTS
jgi:hypothetical protein